MRGTMLLQGHCVSQKSEYSRIPRLSTLSTKQFHMILDESFKCWSELQPAPTIAIDLMGVSKMKDSTSEAFDSAIAFNGVIGLADSGG